MIKNNILNRIYEFFQTKIAKFKKKLFLPLLDINFFKKRKSIFEKKLAIKKLSESDVRMWWILSHGKCMTQTDMEYKKAKVMDTFFKKSP